jgi:hypothetical protein
MCENLGRNTNMYTVNIIRVFWSRTTCSILSSEAIQTKKYRPNGDHTIGCLVWRYTLSQCKILSALSYNRRHVWLLLVIANLNCRIALQVYRQWRSKSIVSPFSYTSRWPSGSSLMILIMIMVSLGLKANSDGVPNFPSCHYMLLM